VSVLSPLSYSGVVSLRQLIFYFSAISPQHCPFIIYLHIGENDLDRMSDGHITSEILCLVYVLSPLSRSGVIILGQQVSFFRDSE